MKKQIQLAGTYHALKYIKNQFNLLKNNTHSRHIVIIRVLNPAGKNKKKDLKRNQTFNNKMCKIIHPSLYYIETVEINFIQEVNIPRSDS